MTQNLGFAEVCLAKTFAGSRGSSEDRLPVAIAIPAIAGINVALWFLIAVALKSLF